jgi:hypothetical protein
MPALYQLGGTLARMPFGQHVLGPVDFDFTTSSGGAPSSGVLPVKVSSVGFWLNPRSQNVTLIAADSNFAFSASTRRRSRRSPAPPADSSHLAADRRHSAASRSSAPHDRLHDR